MTITATKILCKDLQPGDLFSTMGQLYWQQYEREPLDMSVGQKVWMRTLQPCPVDQAEDEVYKIIIET